MEFAGRKHAAKRPHHKYNVFGGVVADSELEKLDLVFVRRERTQKICVAVDHGQGSTAYKQTKSVIASGVQRSDGGQQWTGKSGVRRVDSV